MIEADNAVIMAAGTSSRFAPMSYEMPKGLIHVRGEVLIERQIRQLREAGVREIILVTGYKSEKFSYLKDKFGVILIHNPDYLTRNNNASIYAARKYLHNTWLCSSDNYFTENVFLRDLECASYAAVYADGPTEEWCMHEDSKGFVDQVAVGGKNAWYMLGPAFWSEDFSRRFVQILKDEYDRPETADLLWESIYAAHLDELKMKILKYPQDSIFEFDTMDELRLFDPAYLKNSGSEIMKKLSRDFHCDEGEIVDLCAYKDENNAASGFTFRVSGNSYRYSYREKTYRRI